MQELEAFQLVVIAVLAIVVVSMITRSIKIVPQGTVFIAERFGRYSRTMTPGLHLVVPFVDKVRAGVDMREQTVSFPPQEATTADDQRAEVAIVMYFSVTDAQAAVYNHANYIVALEQAAVAAVRDVIGLTTAADAPSSRDRMSADVLARLEKPAAAWGLSVRAVRFQEIKISRY